MRKRLALALLLLVSLCVTCVSAMGSDIRVLVLLPPKWAMGSEFFDLLDEFSELDVAIDVVSEKLGSYTFWEDSAEGFMSGAIQGFYEWTITHTYEDLELEGYDAVIMGPGHVHTVWIGETGPMAKELVEQAERGLPCGRRVLRCVRTRLLGISQRPFSSNAALLPTGCCAQ